MRKTFVTYCFICLCLGLFSRSGLSAQRTFTYSIVWSSGDLPMLAHAGYTCADGREIKISVFKCYLSRMCCWQQGHLLYADTVVRLLSAQDSLKVSVEWQIPQNTDSISYTLGIDSAMHAQTDLRADLDPVKGMYWTWQSGYIHLKLEGEVKQGNQQQAFAYHLGGYSQEQDACMRLGFSVRPNQSSERMVVDAGAFLSEPMPLRVMQPGATAVALSQKLKAMMQKGRRG